MNGAGNLVGDDRDQRAVVLAERAPHRALDREHADQIVADHEGNRELALRVRQAGNGNRVRDFSPAARLDHLAALRRGVGALLPQVAHVQHLPLLRDNADDPGADPDTSANGLILVAAARHDGQDVAARRGQHVVDFVR